MPLFLYACRCTHGQRHCGSAFSLRLPVAAPVLPYKPGRAKAWQFVGAAGSPGRFWFGAAGVGRSRGERDGSERVNRRAGTLDDTSWLVPLAHYFMGSAQPSERLANEAACFATLPIATEVLGLVKEWRELWQSD